MVLVSRGGCDQQGFLPQPYQERQPWPSVPQTIRPPRTQNWHPGILHYNTPTPYTTSLLLSTQTPYQPLHHCTLNTVKYTPFTHQPKPYTEPGQSCHHQLDPFPCWHSRNWQGWHTGQARHSETSGKPSHPQNRATFEHSSKTGGDKAAATSEGHPSPASLTRLRKAAMAKPAKVCPDGVRCSAGKNTTGLSPRVAPRYCLTRKETVPPLWLNTISRISFQTIYECLIPENIAQCLRLMLLTLPYIFINILLQTLSVPQA